MVKFHNQTKLTCASSGFLIRLLVLICSLAKTLIMYDKFDVRWSLILDQEDLVSYLIRTTLSLCPACIK